MSDWCVLRCAGRSTLNLAATLADDGFGVWTPVEVRSLRVPKMNVRRETKLPLLPSFLFAKSRHLIDLLELEDMPVKPRRGAGRRQPAHRDFSVFRWGEHIPLIADHSLEPLREKEITVRPRRRGPAYAQGQPVRVSKGNFEGMTGVVERSDARDAQVWLSLFGRHMRVTLPIHMLKIERQLAA